MRLGFGLGLSFRGAGRGGPALNTPSLALELGGLPVNAAVEGDDLIVVATVDDGDGFPTTDVELDESGVLVGAMIDAGGGEWTYDLTDVVEGSYSYRARRITAAGNKQSAAEALEVSSSGAPDFIVVDASDFILVDGSDFIQVT